MPAPTRPASLLKRLTAIGSSWGTMAVAALLIAIAITSWVAARDLKNAADWVTHTQRNTNQIELVVGTLKEAESSQRGFLLTGDLKLFRRGLVAEENARTHAKALYHALRDPTQRERAAVLQTLLDRRLESLGVVSSVYQAQGLEAAIELVKQGNLADISGQIVAQAQVMLETENQFLETRQRRSDQTAWVLQGIAAGGLALALWLVVGMGRATARQLRIHEKAMDQIRHAHDELEQSVTRVEEERRVTRALANFAGLLQGSPSVEAAFQVSASSLAKILPGTSGTLYLLRHSRDHLEAMADWGHAHDRPNMMGPHDCWSLRQGRTFAVSGESLRCPHLTNEPPTPTTCVPLRGQGMDLGVLVVYHEAGWANVEMAEAAAEQLALAVANLRLRETLRTQSLRDHLTGLANRRELEEALPREIARADRSGEPLSVMALDIDHFKRFNDTHGHDAGDSLLRVFGRLLSEHVRGEDLVVRLGGEEFAIVLPNTTSEQAVEHGERLLKLVAKMAAHHNGAPLGQVTTSIGVATYPRHTKDSQHLLTLADTALYAAKNAGRNRVELAPLPELDRNA